MPANRRPIIVSFSGIDLSGSAITQDRDETAVLYGKLVDFRAILSGEVPPTSESEGFLSTVRKYSVQARERSDLATPADQSGS